MTDVYIEHGCYAEGWDTLSLLLLAKKRRNGSIIDAEEIALRFRVGYVLFKMGDLPRAQVAQEEVLQLYIGAYGIGFHNTLRALASLDMVLLTQGNKEQFLKVDQDVGRDIIEANLGSPIGALKDQLQILFNLAQFYRCNGYPDISSKMYVRAIRECVKSRRDVDVLWKSALCRLTVVPIGLLHLKFAPDSVRSKRTQARIFTKSVGAAGHQPVAD
jgi:hypothetical protein